MSREVSRRHELRAPDGYVLIVGRHRYPYWGLRALEDAVAHRADLRAGGYDAARIRELYLGDDVP